MLWRPSPPCSGTRPRSWGCMWPPPVEIARHEHKKQDEETQCQHLPNPQQHEYHSPLAHFAADDQQETSSLQGSQCLHAQERWKSCTPECSIATAPTSKAWNQHQ